MPCRCYQEYVIFPLLLFVINPLRFIRQGYGNYVGGKYAANTITGKDTLLLAHLRVLQHGRHDVTKCKARISQIVPTSKKLLRYIRTNLLCHKRTSVEGGGGGQGAKFGKL